MIVSEDDLLMCIGNKRYYAVKTKNAKASVKFYAVVESGLNITKPKHVRTIEMVRIIKRLRIGL